jgi:hypothetical protein
VELPVKVSVLVVVLACVLPHAMITTCALMMLVTPLVVTPASIHHMSARIITYVLKSSVIQFKVANSLPSLALLRMLAIPLLAIQAWDVSSLL